MTPTVTWLGPQKPGREEYVSTKFAEARAEQIRRTLPEELRGSVQVLDDEAPAPRCPNTLDLFSTTTGEDSAA